MKMLSKVRKEGVHLKPSGEEKYLKLKRSDGV
jgi:hypothetical protein